MWMEMLCMLVARLSPMTRLSSDKVWGMNANHIVGKLMKDKLEKVGIFL